MLCLPSILNAPGIRSDWPSTGMRSNNVGASMSREIAPSRIWPAMYSFCCAAFMAASFSRWSRSKRSKLQGEAKGFGGAGATIATMPPFVGRFGDCCATNAIWWVCVSRHVRHEAPLIPAHIVGKQPGRIVLRINALKTCGGGAGCGVRRATLTEIAITALH